MVRAAWVWEGKVKVALVGAALTVSGLGSAAATSTVAGVLLRPDELADRVEEVPGPVELPEPVEVPSREHYVTAIVGQNLFDHSDIGTASTADDVPKATLDWRLLGTLIATPARFSSAMIGLGDDFESREFVGVGDVIGGVTVLSIDETGLVARLADGQEVTLELYTEAPDRKRRRGRRGNRRGRAIEKVGTNHVEVRESLVKRYTNNPARLARLGRARPHRRGGKVVGYRLSRIRRNSHGHKLGLRNGDVVRSVNGHKLTSMNSAMKAYAELQNDDSFEIEVERRRKGRTLRVDLK